MKSCKYDSGEIVLRFSFWEVFEKILIDFCLKAPFDTDDNLQSELIRNHSQGSVPL